MNTVFKIFGMSRQGTLTQTYRLQADALTSDYSVGGLGSEPGLFVVCSWTSGSRTNKYRCSHKVAKKVIPLCQILVINASGLLKSLGFKLGLPYFRCPKRGQISSASKIQVG